MKYFADLTLRRSLDNPMQLIVFDEKNNKMYGINQNNLNWYLDDHTYRKYNFGEDDLVEITKEVATQIATSWGGTLMT